MISYEDAVSAILAEVKLLTSEHVALQNLPGRVLAAEILAPLDLPAFDNSAVDGYAVRTPVTGPLIVTDESAAGGDASSLRVSEGEAVRIFTGAALPAGADAVAMQEDVEREGQAIRLLEPVTKGAHVRWKGEEVRIGEPVLPAGLRVTPAVLGVLATLGLVEVSVFRSLRITVIETGNELVDPGQPLPPGAVYAANGVALAAAAEALGASVTIRRVRDDAQQLRAVFASALTESDMIVTSGGVSVGDHDLVRPTWAHLRVRERFWRVAIKPGKPVFFGRVEEGPLVFGLPGNPVSSLVTFFLFVRPAILAMHGLSDASPIEVEAGADLRGDVDRDEFVRVSVRGGVATPLERQGSHMASGLATADALIRLRRPVTRVSAGARVLAMPLTWGWPS